MKRNSTRIRLALEAEALRAVAMETEAMLSDLDEEELEAFAVEFLKPSPGLDLKLDSAYQVARAIAAERREKLSRLRSAFDFHDTKAALDIARELCGAKHDEKSNRTNPRIH